MAADEGGDFLFIRLVIGDQKYQFRQFVGISIQIKTIHPEEHDGRIGARALVSVFEAVIGNDVK